MMWKRPDHREPNQLRPVSFERNFTRFSPGSVLAKSGDTKVLCSVSIEPGVPKFLQNTGQGWLTAEYRMLPGATPQRQPREFLKLSGRTQEIQRLIGRSLRAALDLKALGEYTITVDTDVIQADAGTRTTAITGGFVALVDALNSLIQKGQLQQLPICHQIAAISVGLLEGEPYLDLNYTEDVAADIDFNLVMTEELEIIELQGTAELGSFSREQLDKILNFAELGIQELLKAQRQILGEFILLKSRES
ncbi:ribonuclease PH [Planktothrix mougeotii]|nr:ribonuclease PH [Planktothrix mougeotii]